MKYNLRVAIDAKCLCYPISGINTVVSNTIFHLSTDIECILLTPRPLHEDFKWLENKPNVLIKNSIFFGNISFYQNQGENIFWGPSHRLPFLKPRMAHTVLTIHDLVWRKMPETMRIRGRVSEAVNFHSAVRRADRIICVSNSTANDLKEFYPEVESKTKVIKLGASIKKVKPFKSTRPYALFVGTIEPRKNIERLIFAISSLNQEVLKSIDFVFAGRNGWGSLKLDGIQKLLPSTVNIRIEENPSIERVHQLYRGCRFVLFPSLYEGYGLPIMEAFQYGKPVVTSASSSMSEISDGASLLVDPYDTNSIAGAINRLFFDEDLYYSLSRLAKKKSRAQTWENVADQMSAIFHEFV